MDADEHVLVGAEESSPKDRTRRAKQLGLSALVSMLLLLGLELVGRVSYGSSFDAGRQSSDTWKVCGRYDEGLGWANRAGARGLIETELFTYRVDINSAGLRDPERTLQKRKGQQRVVLLGDSVSWGWGVNDGERFSDVLERDLGSGTEVINLAVPGYGTDQHLWSLLDHGLGYEPDVVLLGLVLNDIAEVSKERVYNLNKPRYLKRESGTWELTNRPVPDQRGALARFSVQLWRHAVSNSAALTWLDRWGQTSAIPKDSVEKTYRRPNTKFLRRLHEMCDKVSDPESLTFMLLQRIHEACEERDIPLLVFNVAHKHDQYLYEPGFPAPPIKRAETYSTYLSKRVREAGKAIGFQALSVDAAMLEAVTAGHRLQCGDGHLNLEGNRVVAAALEPTLRSLLKD